MMILRVSKLIIAFADPLQKENPETVWSRGFVLLLKSSEGGDRLIYCHLSGGDRIDGHSQLKDGIVRKADDLRRQDPGFRNHAKSSVHTVKRQVLGRRHQPLLLRHPIQLRGRDQEPHEFVRHVYVFAVFVDGELQIRHIQEDSAIIRHGDRDEGVFKRRSDKSF